MKEIEKTIKTSWNGREVTINVHNYSGTAIRLNYEGWLEIDGVEFFAGFTDKDQRSEEENIKDILTGISEDIKSNAAGVLVKRWREYKSFGKNSEFAKKALDEAIKKQPIAIWLVKTFNL